MPGAAPATTREMIRPHTHTHTHPLTFHHPLSCCDTSVMVSPLVNGRSPGCSPPNVHRHMSLVLGAAIVCAWCALTCARVRVCPCARVRGRGRVLTPSRVGRASVRHYRCRVRGRGRVTGAWGGVTRPAVAARAPGITSTGACSVRGRGEGGARGGASLATHWRGGHAPTAAQPATDGSPARCVPATLCSKSRTQQAN